LWSDKAKIHFISREIDMDKFNKGLIGLLGIGLFVNGLIMLYNPAGWYFAVPTVPATGPFNQHFLRDIGIIYVLVGALYVTGIYKPAQRLWMWGAATTWLALHGFFHLWEIGAGICGPETIVQNGHAVYLPAIIGLVGIILDRRQQRTQTKAG
jgi:hypothetical protein